MVQLEEKVQKVAELLKNSSYSVVLTGAGLSDQAGGNFRSPGSGLWTMFDPDDFTIQRFKANPNAFYELGVPFFSMLEEKPTAAHKIITALEKSGLIKAIITKNIDGFHQEAGAKNVYEIYGTLKSASCTSCSYQVATKEIIDEVETGHLPLCPHCGAPLKPDVVLFGEPLSVDFHRAKHEMEKSDLVLVLGTEVLTAPTKELLAESGRLIIINHGATTQDSRAKVVINESPVVVLPLLLKALDL